MSKYTISFNGWAGYTATVEIDDAEYEDEDERKEAAIEAAYNEAPYLCAQCSGWGEGPSLEISDTWDVDEGSIERV